MAQRDVFAPVTGELRQHRADLRAEGEETVFDEGHDHRGGIELGNGSQRPEGVFGGGGVGPGIAGEIENGLPLDGDRGTGRRGTPLLDDAMDELLDRCEIARHRCPLVLAVHMGIVRVFRAGAGRLSRSGCRSNGHVHRFFQAFEPFVPTSPCIAVGDERHGDPIHRIDPPDATGAAEMT